MEVAARLRELVDSGHISIEPRRFMKLMRILQFPSPGCGKDSNGAIAEMIYKQFQSMAELWTQSHSEAIELFITARCTSVGLAEYLWHKASWRQDPMRAVRLVLTGKPVVLHPGKEEEDIDPQKVKSILGAVPDRHHPRLLARVAAGVHSIRVTQRNLQHSPVLRSTRGVNSDVSSRSLHLIISGSSGSTIADINALALWTT